jgi:integrase
MGLYRRGKIYWFSIQYQGKRIQESTGTRSKKVAERIYAKVLSEIQEGRWYQAEKAKTITFSELVEKYMKKYQKQRDPSSIKHLLPYFGEMRLSDIVAETVEDYIMERADREAKPATIYQEFALGRRVFNVARRRWHWVASNPFADVQFSELLKIDNARDRWLSVEEEKVLLAHATPSYIKDVIVFAIHTGCRRGEIISLTWKDHMDLRRRVITVKATKNGTIKSIPMSETLFRILSRRSKIRHISGRVFPVEALTLKDAFERAVKKAGIRDLHFHDLRHTFATRLVQAGVDLLAVKSLLGHRSLKMTERYAHHYPESLRPSVKVLDACYNSATVELCTEPEGLAGTAGNPVLSRH